MKLSIYNEIINLEDNSAQVKKYLVFNTYSSKLKLVDSSLYEKLSASDFSSVSPAVLSDLKDAHILTTSSFEWEEVACENRCATLAREHISFVILPTSKCQLACSYCGQNHCKTNDNGIDVDSICAFINKQITSNLADVKSFTITWFGGEPLLNIRAITDISSYSIRLASEKSLKFTSKVITNGVALSRETFNHLHSTCKINTFEITLDGTAEHHNKRRPLKNQQGSFEKILSNLKDISLTNAYAKITIRMNVDKENALSIKPLIDLLYKEQVIPRVTLYFAPIHEWGDTPHPNILSNEDFARGEVESYFYMHSLGIKINLLPPRKQVVCNATRPLSFVIDPFGNLFKCTEVPLVDSYTKEQHAEHCVGHTCDERVKEHPFLNFQSRDGKLNDCYRCSIYPICSGYCPKAWHENRQACPSYKINIKERILLTYLSVSSKHGAIRGEQ